MNYFRLARRLHTIAWRRIEADLRRQSKLKSSICGGKGMRHNGLFKCSCGAGLNADYNGAKNIMKRALGLASKAGASVNMLRTNPMDSLNPMMMLEARCIS